MKKTIVLVLCSALILVSGDTASDVKSKTLNDKVNITPSSTSTTVAPETTAVPSTTSKTTTTTTTTSTTTPSTTTSSTTQAPTTTPAPITTHAPVPPTPPTPVPNPETKKWNITGPDGNQIIAKMAVQLIMYNATTQKNESKAINVPTNNETYVSGTFDKNSESMTLAWKPLNSNINNSLTLYFKQDSKTYLLNRVEVSVVLPIAATPSKFVHKQEHFNTTLGNSYRCIRLQTFKLTKENDDKVAGEMKVSNLQFQAFKSDHKENFGLAEDCAFDTPDVVPIAVGCILAGAVVIVLVAYLISRRRSQAHGYHSM